MLHSPHLSASLGADLRALRKARGLTLIEVADRLGRSVGWMSQIERDLSSPTIEELKSLAETYAIPLSLLFGETTAPEVERGRIVRAANRRRIGAEAGLVESLLSPDLTGPFEVIHSTFAPGASQTIPVQRGTEELGVLTSGQLDLTLGEQTYTLDPGDSFRIRGEAYAWANPHAVPAEAIWVIAPPVY